MYLVIGMRAMAIKILPALVREMPTDETSNQHIADFNQRIRHTAYLYEQAVYIVTAEKIIIELKEKIKNDFADIAQNSISPLKSTHTKEIEIESDNINDAKAALLSLGYKFKEINNAFSSLEIDLNEDSEVIIKKILANI